MKNILYILTAFLVFSCSPPDNSHTALISDFHPPQWIQGTWKQELFGLDSRTGFKFSANDLCTLIGVAEHCQQEIIDSQRKSGTNVIVEEVITSTSYSVKISSSGQQKTFSFQKISDTKIEWNSDSAIELLKK
ncbi:MAG TPA: hypothetical protein VIH09_07755 [Flavobacterium sp.]|uniref:hypothetical protein n=1 Tax=Flavobacterium sp. TaxID=239 RepID=UPI002F3FC55F